jgi:hypothetical protein
MSHVRPFGGRVSPAGILTQFGCLPAYVMDNGGLPGTDAVGVRVRAIFSELNT